MTRVLFVFLFLAMQVNLFAQGINFRDMAFKEALKVAQTEKKLVFLDCYTSWCGPCRMLAKNVFTNEEVGKVFNEKFICLKMDMEKGTGPELMKKYKVGAFPTLLFINGDGQLKHSVSGFMQPDALLKQAEIALQGKKTLEAMTARYDAGERSDAFVEEYLEILFKASQDRKQAEVATEYINKMDFSHFYSRKTWDLLNKHLSDPLSPILKKAFLTKFRFEPLVGGDTLQLYFDYTQRKAVQAFVWRTPRKGTFNQQRYDELLHFLKNAEQPNAPQYIATLYAVKQVEEGNLRGMVDEMKRALHYGIFYNGDSKLLFFQGFMRHVETPEQKELALEVDDLLRIQAEEAEIEYYQTKLTELRIRLLKKIQETEKAAQLEQKLADLRKKNAMRR